MSNKGHTNLVIVPSRNRPDNAERTIKALQEHSRISDFCIAIDDDQADLYPRLDGVMYEVNPRLWMNGTLNLVASRHAHSYKTVHFLGDDHLVKTPGWDEKLYAPIKDRGFGLSYGDDLFQRVNLATSVMMSTNIIKTLGFMAPPKLTHLFMDNFWMNLGYALQCIDFVEEVVIEHLHFMNGKSESDAGYIEVNSHKLYSQDQKVFLDYMNKDFRDDIAKLVKEFIIE